MPNQTGNGRLNLDRAINDTNTTSIEPVGAPPVGGGGPFVGPYSISAINDVLWYSESETEPNTVVRFDPKTEKFQSWAIPGGGNIVRNVDVTPDGNWVLANSLTNEVTLVRIQK